VAEADASLVILSNSTDASNCEAARRGATTPAIPLKNKTKLAPKNDHRPLGQNFSLTIKQFVIRCLRSIINYKGDSMLKDIRNVINGAVFATTLIIPGISGSIFAIMLGFYDELLRAINHFKEDYRKNTRYLATFVLGIIVGTLVFSSIIVYLLDHYSFPTMLLFMGLLLGVIPYVFSKAKGEAQKLGAREMILAIVPMLALFALSRGVTVTMVNPTETLGAMTMALMLYVFLAGAINGATLVIPGLSGSFLLLIMGLYPLIIYALASLGSFLLDPTDVTLLFHIFMVLVPFGIGALGGFFSMARLMERLIRDYSTAVYAVILGLVLGSAAALIEQPVLVQSGMTTAKMIAGAIMLCVGCVVSYLLGKRL